MNAESTTAEAPQPVTQSATPPRLNPFTALQFRDFRLLWTGVWFSASGNFMQQFTLGWLAVQLAVRNGTPDLGPLYIGFIGLSTAIPGLLLGLFAGVMADRVERRRLLMATSSTIGLVAATLAFITFSDRITIVFIVIASGITATAIMFDFPARQAMLARLVPEHAIVSAVSLNSVAMLSSTLVGPLIGGLLIATIGPGGVMVVNAFAAVIMISALFAMRPMPVESVTGQPNLFAAVGEGISYIWRDPLLRWMMGLFIFAAILSRPYTQLMPAIAHDILHVGAVQLSWLLASSGVGAVFGSVATASLGWVRRRAIVAAAATGAMGLLIVTVGTVDSLVPAMLLLPPASFAGALALAMSITIFQVRTPDRIRGRVMGVAMMTLNSMMPLGTSLLGAFATAVGVNVAIMAGSGAVLLASLFTVVWSRPVRRFGTEAERGPAEDAQGALRAEDSRLVDAGGEHPIHRR